MASVRMEARSGEVKAKAEEVELLTEPSNAGELKESSNEKNEQLSASKAAQDDAGKHAGAGSCDLGAFQLRVNPPR